MSKPSDVEALAELRAKLDDWELRYKKDYFNLYAGTRTAKLEHYRELKIACCRTALLLIENIRGVIDD